MNTLGASASATAFVSKKSRSTARLARDRQDLMSRLFERGCPDNQWIIYKSTSNTWETAPLRREARRPDRLPLQHDPVTDDSVKFPDGPGAVMIGDAVVEWVHSPSQTRVGTP